MNKSQFNDILNYIKNRPTEAARLREVLGIAASGQGEGAIHREGQAECICKGSADGIKWVTAAKAGRLIDKSGKWVRENIRLFPSAWKRWHGERFTWMLDRDEVITNYLEHIQFP